jgi:hypothetical protein
MTYKINLSKHLDEKIEKPYNPPFQCLYCGRFAHFIQQYTYYNGEINDIIFEWRCKKCGLCREGTQ